MSPGEIIDESINSWKAGVRHANEQAVKTGLYQAPPIVIREGIGAGRYIAVSVDRPSGLALGLCSAEHDRETKRTVIVALVLMAPVAILSLPSPFNALALSDGAGDLVAEIPNLGAVGQWRTQDA